MQSSGSPKGRRSGVATQPCLQLLETNTFSSESKAQESSSSLLSANSELCRKGPELQGLSIHKVTTHGAKIAPFRGCRPTPVAFEIINSFIKIPADSGRHLKPLPEAESSQLWPTPAATVRAQRGVPTTPSRARAPTLWQAKPICTRKALCINLGSSSFTVITDFPPSRVLSCLRH